MQRSVQLHGPLIAGSLAALVVASNAFAGAAVFAPADDYAVGDDPESLTSGDYDGDEALDLAVANSGDDDVSILLGDGAGDFNLDDDYDGRATSRRTSSTGQASTATRKSTSPS